MGDNSDLQALFDQASARAQAALDAAKVPVQIRIALRFYIGTVTLMLEKFN